MPVNHKEYQLLGGDNPSEERNNTVKEGGRTNLYFTIGLVCLLLISATTNFLFAVRQRGPCAPHGDREYRSEFGKYSLQ